MSPDLRVRVEAAEACAQVVREAARVASLRLALRAAEAEMEASAAAADRACRLVTATDWAIREFGT